MARLRENKKLLRQWLESDNWTEYSSQILDMEPRQVTGTLFSFLLLGGEMTHRAARALGPVIEKMRQNNAEEARDIMRRIMWHMNEESGNIGWGKPEAFAEILVSSETLAKEFHSILLSYIMDTGRDDNFCDHALLRRSCYFAVGRLAAVRPKLCQRSIAWLMQSLTEKEEDMVCRGMALWALMQFPTQDIPSFDIYPLLKNLGQYPEKELAHACAIFDGESLKNYTIKDLLEQAKF